MGKSPAVHRKTRADEHSMLDAKHTGAAAPDVRLHILLVEDNPADADLCTEYLAGAFLEKIQISHATSLGRARELLRTATQPPVDAILLDLGLPDASGLEALIGLRELVPKLPIVVLTGGVDSNLGVAAIREHAEDYCPKSAMTPDTLLRILRLALERHRWRNRYRNLLEISPDGMIVLDAPTVSLGATAAVFANGGGGAEGGDASSAAVGNAGNESTAPSVAGMGGGGASVVLTVGTPACGTAAARPRPRCSARTSSRRASTPRGRAPGSACRRRRPPASPWRCSPRASGSR